MAKSKAFMPIYRAKKPVDPRKLSESRDEYGSLANLVDRNGHISLEVSDYTGHSREELEEFFAAQPYEVLQGYTASGELVHIASQWSNNSVSYTSGDISGRAIHTLAHNHPIDSDTVLPIFSGADVGDLGSIFYQFGVREIHVRTSESHTFRLTAEKGWTLDSGNRFGRVYRRRIGIAQKHAQEAYEASSGKMTDREFVTFMTTELDTWLKKSAGTYGLGYQSYWTGER